MVKPGKTILVVEDDEPLLAAVSHKLRLAGFSVLQASDGVAGLKSALEHHPDLILLGILLPKMDGMTVLKKLRADAWGADARVILLTNLSDTDSIATAAEGEVYDYLVKNHWTLDEVVQKVKERLKMA